MSAKLKNLWDDKKAKRMSAPERLQYRSNLLGSDLRVTNFGGGNTSAKLRQKDPLTGKMVDVMWVKGSGGDLGSIKLDGFSTLYLEKLHALEGLYRGLEHEDEMVGYLPHCTFNCNARAASIDTPLHSFIPHKHVDHMHPDSVIAIACTKNSKALTKKIFKGRLGWLPWQRPGFDLGLKLGEMATANPELEGIVLEGHGLFSWGATSKECYLKTLEIIQLTADWLEENNKKPAFGGVKYEKALPASGRHDVAAALMPIIRGKITSGDFGHQMKVGHFNDSKEILQFVNSKNLKPLAALGTSCPDHFLRTKIRPLVVDFKPTAADREKEIARVIAGLEGQLEDYRADYAGYYERSKRHNSPAMRDPNAIVYLIPGVGMITFAKDKATARIAGEFYVNAINVMGACVMLADIDEKSLKSTHAQFSEEFSKDVVRTTLCDVTDEESVTKAIANCSVEFGGMDVLVSNAGIAASAPLDETTLESWDRTMSILSTGYFLVSRESFKVLKAQNIGGSVVFVVSKNGLVASPGAAAYCTAKGAEIQLARAVALEGAPLGIRANVVNPDAVLKGSKIWNSGWKKERADAYSMTEEELEGMYRDRSLLKRSVFPEDIAEAVYFFASDNSEKSTGNIINVDAGHAPSFTR